MSVSIFNTYRYDSDFNVKFTETKMQTAVPRAKLDHVRRNLFGPVDRKECSRFAEEELAKHQMSASQKWGFDFVRGCPMEDTKLFLWERVPPTNEIPEMYALSRAAHIRPIEPDRTPSKKRHHMRRDSFLDLYDELADQSNRYVNTSKSNVLDLSFEDVDGGHTSASSCDEDSFEEEDNVCDLNWMPSTSNISTSPLETNKTTEICHATDNITLVPVSNRVDRSTVASLPSCDTSCSDKTTNSNCNNASNSSGARILRNSPRIREKRQRKMTDFLKERKRLQPAPKKISPKKARLSPSSNNGTILSHFRQTMH
ncbi:uncharacterized protein LOC116338486 [Contarinia nasturtii]|uniref:uncharacterized protein LOC116338486 n=1 Tax=Contarinia nasturtii TaxID=265458 RepID=UPI0012D4B3CF|nr:uncharacterized protein LOC116338486 [Contarinia nasturtii]XP_031619640.1 uncharacterized protein LOC116338486 [Contarinia nasturtii]XP_031619642.1 uncharacterized protein LOC116338486 [Contarinia nasturtii]